MSRLDKRIRVRDEQRRVARKGAARTALEMIREHEYTNPKRRRLFKDSHPIAYELLNTYSKSKLERMAR